MHSPAPVLYLHGLEGVAMGVLSQYLRGAGKLVNCSTDGLEEGVDCRCSAWWESLCRLEGRKAESPERCCCLVKGSCVCSH